MRLKYKFKELVRKDTSIVFKGLKKQKTEEIGNGWNWKDVGQFESNKEKISIYCSLKKKQREESCIWIMKKCIAKYC